MIIGLNAAEIIVLAKRLRHRKANARGKNVEKNVIPLLFLMNLAASDLFVGLTMFASKCMTYLLKWKAVQRTEGFNFTFNILVFAFLRISLLSSIFNLMSLTVDRLFTIQNAIVYHMKFRTKHALIVIVISWLLSFVFVGIHFYVVYYSGLVIWAYDLVIFPAVVFPATLVFGIGYWKIVKSIFAQGKELRRIAARGNNNNDKDKSSNSNNNEGRSSSSNNDNKPGNHSNVPPHVLKRELAISRLAGTVVFAFVVCWVPVTIIGCLLMAKALPSGIYYGMIINIGFFLAFINSAVNPILYFGFKNKFLRNLKGWVLKCCKKDEGTSESGNKHEKHSKLMVVPHCSKPGDSSELSPATSCISVETTF